MGKLTKRQSALHLQACELVASDRPLTVEEREFVLLNWQESVNARQVVDNAFFTPLDLARDFSLAVPGDRVVDLCAGTGRLAFAYREQLRSHNGEPDQEYVCVERNPQFVEVGRRVMPDAEWICGDVFDVIGGLGEFDTAIANPPYARELRSRRAPRYRGPEPAYEVIHVAGTVARHGVFLIPQPLAPFRLSGRADLEEARDARYEQFERTTGIALRPNVGIDTAYYRHEWRGVAPKVEIVTCHFSGTWHQPDLMEVLA